MKKVFIMCVAAAGLILASCGGDDKKSSDASTSEGAGTGEGNPQSNEDGTGVTGADICECFKSAKSEEDFMKCDASKSMDELKSIAMDCAKKLMQEQTGTDANSGGGDMPAGESGGPAMPDMPAMPEGPDM